MAHTTRMAAPKRVYTGRLRQKLNRSRLPLFELPAVLRRSKNQATRAVWFRAIGNRSDFETMVVVGSCDLKLNLGAALHVNG
jgi:hypothetical protein